MRKKFKVQREVEVIRMCCDRCKTPIEDESGVWKEGTYQSGENLKGGIGTWCSENCEKIYETKVSEKKQRAELQK